MKPSLLPGDAAEEHRHGGGPPDTVAGRPAPGTGRGQGAAAAALGTAARALGAARFDPLWAALLTLAVARTGSGGVQLWRDELASWSAARRGPGELLALLGNVDAVSGAYYLVLHGWISLFGDSPAVLRMPSALAMAGTAAFVVLTARDLFDRRTALFAGVLFAAIPAVTRFGQEARAYAFVMLAAAAATWLLMRALRRPTAARWLPYAVAVTCTGLFHIVSLLVLLPHTLIVLGRRQDSRPPSWRLPAGYALAVLAALLPLVPLILVGRRQVGRQINWLHAPDFGALAGLWSSLSCSPLVSFALLAAAVLPLAWPRGRRPAAELALVAALPIPAVWVISQTGTSYFLDRYLLFTLPAWVVLAAAGLGALRPRAAGVAGLVLLVAAGANDQRLLRTEHAKNAADGRRAAAVIAAGYEPGDGFAPAGGGERLYMFGPLVEYYLPGDVNPKDVFAERSAVARHDLFPAECARPAACLDDATRRIWVVARSGTPNPYNNFPPDQEEALRGHFRPVATTKAGELQVTLVERTG
ncbi:glycosyltransferase family 39 protein [Streptomyces sp. IBSNAI002]|uniref:glycosyltransferase family 39 protein n=1 Tax=Streptomyces sp. IBSNAI002 TaxID=3457500 RepID=UPI003FD12C59